MFAGLVKLFKGAGSSEPQKVVEINPTSKTNSTQNTEDKKPDTEEEDFDLSNLEIVKFAREKNSEREIKEWEKQKQLAQKKKDLNEIESIPLNTEFLRKIKNTKELINSETPIYEQMLSTILQ